MNNYDVSDSLQPKKPKSFVLLLEEGCQYEVYSEKKDTFGPHELIVCSLSVDAINYCQQNKIDFIVPEDCYSGEEGEMYWKRSREKLYELREKLNHYYYQQFPPVSGFSFDMGNYHFFMLCHFFGALHYRSFLLWKVIEKYSADRIIAFQSSVSNSFSRPFPVSRYRNCYVDLCLHSVYRERVILIKVDDNESENRLPFKVRLRQFVGGLLRKNEILKQYLNYYRNNLPVRLVDIVMGCESVDILLVGSAGPWKYVLTDSSLSGRFDVCFEEDDVDYSGEVIKNWFFEWFGWKDNFCGFEVSALGCHEMTRLKVLAEKIIDSHKDVVKQLKNYKATIFSVCPYAEQQYTLSVAKYLGIPRVCYQHGEMALYFSGLWDEASELTYLSHYFSYGCQVSNYKAERVIDDSFEQAVSVGSPALDKVRSISSTKESYILYASSKFIDYGAGFVPRYTDSVVNENQYMLINYFERFLELNSEKRVIWKLNQELLTRQASVKTEKVKVIQHEKTFLELLPDAGIVVLDRPSTTSLECCVTEKPLFVLLANKNWFSEPEALLRKRAVIADTPKELLGAIDAYLKHGIYPADVTNREFVRAYGSHLDDGLSVSRAVDELQRIVRSS